MLTVGELIVKLQAFDPGERVCADTDLGASDIEDVIEVPAEPGADPNNTLAPIRARHVLIY